MKKIRVFAGPNGSGKSTLYRHILENHTHIRLGCFVNADDIRESFTTHGYFDLTEYNLTDCTHADFKEQYLQSTSLID